MFAREMNAGLSVMYDPFSIMEVTLLVEASISVLNCVIDSTVNAIIKNATHKTGYLPVIIDIFIW